MNDSAFWLVRRDHDVIDVPPPLTTFVEGVAHKTKFDDDLLAQGCRRQGDFSVKPASDQSVGVPDCLVSQDTLGFCYTAGSQTLEPI